MHTQVKAGDANWSRAIWTAEHVANARISDATRIPVITARDISPVLPGLDVWDMWPLTLRDGSTAAIDGGVLWFALAAPVQPNPIDRHGLARLRLLRQIGDQWDDCGNALPDGLSPGSRDWSGSAIYDFTTREVTLFFTAAGRRGEPKLTVEQRLFQTTGRLENVRGKPVIRHWSQPFEIVKSDDNIYVHVNQAEGAPGKLKAFRDPAYFRDPADGKNYVLFAASLKASPHQANGCIAMARADDDRLEHWTLMPPLLTADGVSNELERPHMILANNLYYLFWSTQNEVFAPSVHAGPTGLYGMVAPALSGPYQPLNESGLVIANPESEPLQAYSWYVLGDLTVTSFVDYWGMEGRRLAEHPALLRSQFGGVPAPFLKLSLNGAQAGLAK